MKIPVMFFALMTVCALSLSLRAQDYAPAPVQAPPPPDNGNYDIPPNQGPPPPDQQGAPGPQGPAPQNGPGPDQGAPDQGASFQTFYDNLAQQGSWIQSSDYGYVWQPSVNDPSWAPYTDGHWVYTDAGWTWASDEPWGWATYHYGRWVNLDGTGWCWVPGYTWAPAWVSWRYGDGYCGWAPLPPESFVGIDYIGDGIQITAGFHIGGDCDSYYGIGAGCYHFVPVTCIGYSNYHRYYAEPHNNYAIINRTTNVTNLNVNRNGGNGEHHGFNGVTTGGPSLAQVNAVSQTPVQHVTLTHASQPGASGKVSNNSLALFAPNVAPGASGQPARVNESVGRVPVNRGIDVTKPLAVSRTLAPPAPTASQVQAAQLAQFSAPPHAKVVTASNQVKPVLQTPLTTLKPIATTSQTRVQGGVANMPGNPAYSPQSHAAGNAAASGQGNSFYQITHPGQGASSNSPVVHSQAPSISQPQGTTSSATIHQEGNNSSQANPFYQHQHAAPATATPTHTQTASPQTQAAPAVVHRSDNSGGQESNQSNPPQQSSPASSQQAQGYQPSQGFPAPSNNQGGGEYHNQGGGNGGGYNHQQNH